MSFDEYFAAQQSNLEKLRRLPQFTDLAVPIHKLYDSAVQLVPPSAPLIFGRLLLLSHRNFLSVMTLALRGLPDDATAIARRAVEAARTALALKHDRENLRRWLAYDERMARWKQRQEGLKPDPLQSRLIYPPGHALCEDLGRLFGMYSDGAVHFTPEFLSQQTWRVQDADTDAPQMWLSYFGDLASIEQALSALAAAHLLCLAAFDECYDGAFSRDAAWRAARGKVQLAGRRLFPEPPGREEEEDP